MHAYMQGHLEVEGHLIRPAGFQPAHMVGTGLTPLAAPAAVDAFRDLPQETRALLQRMERGEAPEIQRNTLTGTMDDIAWQMGKSLADIHRAITTTMTAFPVRENLEAEVYLMLPLETPVRNRLPRTPGSGTASHWRRATSIGGGWGTGVDQPGGVSNLQMFIAETGAAVEHTTVYADTLATYKYLATFHQVSAPAEASGSNFGNQYAI